MHTPCEHHSKENSNFLHKNLQQYPSQKNKSEELRNEWKNQLLDNYYCGFECSEYLIIIMECTSICIPS